MNDYQSYLCNTTIFCPPFPQKFTYSEFNFTIDVWHGKAFRFESVADMCIPYSFLQTHLNVSVHFAFIV